ncbi:MAG TPA: nuclear transport factor 2 family protein [Daejeonella sp.]|nr:nuclear transport factor 2 family protein [Daejeonella sp.]
MKRLVFITCFLFLTITSIAQEKQAVLKVLDTQRLAWNKGDLDSFMQTYWKSDSLLFVGQSGPKYGWQTTLDNYRKSYPDKAAMGTLTFDIKEVRFITANDAFVLGAWHLQRQKDQPKGFFTLLLRQINGEWVIVADHSS